MEKINNFEYPDHLKEKFNKAKRLEWITIGYLITTALAVYFTMGNSQAMKTAWFEDILSLTPSVSFLIAAKIYHKPPTKNFPYGYHRVVSIAYLCSALALFSVGCFLIFDSSMTLINAEHATIGTIVLFGHQFWLGYLMIAAMLWGTFPAIILGKKKLPIAEKLHEKNLFTDAKMNKADWMTAAAAIFGVLGIGMGWWWADATAAIIISIDIVHDGFVNLKQAVYDLMDQVPMTVDYRERDPLIEQVKETLSNRTWIKEFTIRLREEGHIYLGEAFVVPNVELNQTQLIEEAAEAVQDLDWRIQEFVIMPVRKLPSDEKK
ncbi:cation diffusion facilitator family transporter [Pontibacter sp. MBLB2868]|uniref:cation diffusion facilitator family transporter n=1 Tax=Pontibacter sp. MBLB2868 TaxID=3451555 RepID=UPI003F753EE1